MGFGSGDVDGGEADFLGYVLERGDGRQTAAVFLGGRGELGERNTDAARLLAGGLRMREGCESENKDENGRNREKTPRASPEHVLIVSQRVLRLKRPTHDQSDGSQLRMKRPAKPSAGLAGR